jgi:O-antigen ligase
MNPKPPTNSDRHFLLWGDIPFWTAMVFWSFMASTKTPWYDIESVPVSLKDIVNIGLGGFYWLVPAITKRSLKFNPKPWHCHLPLATISLLIYAAVSVEWSRMQPIDARAMLYTLLLTAGAFLMGYYLIQKRSLESIRPFLWQVTVLVAAVGLLYSAGSFFSLGLGTENTYESESFGVQRVRGPLFVSTTGFFILIPALAFAIQELLKNPSQCLFKVPIIFSLTLTLVGLGSRSALLLLAVFFLLVILSLKNKKQAIAAFILIAVVTAAAGLIFFSRAKTDRLKSLEDTTRSDTYSTSFAIIYNREDNINFFGSGYGSYWPWYIPDIQGARETNQYFNLVWNPYGNLLYHPHSTILLLIVELGVPGLLYFLFMWIILSFLLLQNLGKVEFPVLNCGMFASAFSMFFDFFLFRSAQVNSIWWLFLFGTLALNYGNNKHCFYPTDTAGNTEINTEIKP